MRTWTEYAVRIRTGSGEERYVGIEGPEPHRVGQYARRPADDGSNRTEPDMDALRVRTVRVTEWRRPKAVES
jgi:hypothetical protein